MLWIWRWTIRSVESVLKLYSVIISSSVITYQNQQYARVWRSIIKNIENALLIVLYCIQLEVLLSSQSVIKQGNVLIGRSNIQITLAMLSASTLAWYGRAKFILCFPSTTLCMIFYYISYCWQPHDCNTISDDSGDSTSCQSFGIGSDIMCAMSDCFLW